MARLASRKYHIIGLFSFFFIVYLVRLFYIQIVHEDYFAARAKSDSVDKVIEYPIRGNIYDRNGKVLVGNEFAYDIMITMRNLKIDTARFCRLMGIDTAHFNSRVKLIKDKEFNRGYSSRIPQVFRSLVKSEEYGGIQEQLFNYKGITIQKRTIRNYPRPIASHVLGHVSKVSPRDLKRDKFYTRQDYKGSAGLESYYEKELRGKKGYKRYLKNIHGLHIGSYQNGELDTLPQPGHNLNTSIDIDLQEYGEYLMQGKIGAIVAIEPKTGEVLSMVNAPTYDPNLLVGGRYGENYKKLSQDEKNIIYPRAIKSRQPPGSIVKTMQSLIAMNLGLANKNTEFGCNKKLVGCHNHRTPLTLPEAVQHSCNPYYFNLVNRIIHKGVPGGGIREGMDLWEKYVRSFGFGNPLGIDLYGEKDGNVPDVREYDKIYGKNHWNFRTIYSIAIGQGEFSLTPLQMANLSCVLANKGYYYTPRFVKEIGTQKIDRPDSLFYHQSMIDTQHFDLIHNGMQWVLEQPGGTARRSRIKDITICGKTGTSQNPHGDDHSVFIAFAPRQNPKIALVVFVENAGGGGGTAAPIASLMIEKYLKGKIERSKLEKEMVEKRFYD
jgi:penicillin-binding protein 2